MKFVLNNEIKHILILGAGASVDYGLPTWEELNELIKIKIEKDQKNLYVNKTEILNWLEKIGTNKHYQTLDECITTESQSQGYHDNGAEIENEIFKVIRDIFNEIYKENEHGWIRTLNEKIIKNNKNLEDEISFISFNYDNILDRNLLVFDYLSNKRKQITDRNRLHSLSGKTMYCFYPHGYFSSQFKSSHLYKEKQTNKTDVGGFIDTISCYESYKHEVSQNYYSSNKLNLYILGLGGGLEINLNNIHFEDKNRISGIHVTIKNKEKEEKIINFLNKQYGSFPSGIKVYKDCNELINKCFN